MSAMAGYTYEHPHLELKTQPRFCPVSLSLYMTDAGNTKGGSIIVLFDWFGISCMTTAIFCFYLENILIQTSQTGGQRYSDTAPFSIPWLKKSTSLAAALNVDKLTTIFAMNLIILCCDLGSDFSSLSLARYQLDSNPQPGDDESCLLPLCCCLWPSPSWLFNKPTYEHFSVIG